ncbi:SpoIIE family protein phosphatase [Streptomyces sp. NPDC053542]|uniref:SpoIIE family protein phosphatase n=1 Tax=Streptomyces sp. NPDC053542 TaxID=3365710 RepID=UPI0037D5D102
MDDLDLGSRLFRAAVPVLGRLESMLVDTRLSILLTDGEGRVLYRRAGERALDRHLDAVQLAPGFTYSERLAGTNGMGTALAEGKPRNVHGQEHFAERLQPFACFAAPVHDPLSGRVEGVVDLSCWSSDAHPTMEAIVREAGAAVEQGILDMGSQREHALFETYMRARHRSRGAVVAMGSSLADPDRPVGSGLPWRDQERLREAAAELVSQGVLAIREVPLSTGQVATLLCRPVTTPSGVSGAAVEAYLPHPLGPRVTAPAATVRETPRSLPAIGAHELRESRRPESPAVADETPGRAERLVLLGEPTVGKIAIRTRRRLQLLCEAGVRIGTTLDVSRTAEELAEVAVPQLADFATVDLLKSVLRWEEHGDTSGELRRLAIGSIRPDCPFAPVGTEFRFVGSTPQARSLATEESILEPDLTAVPGWLAQDPGRGEKLLREQGIHSLITVPLRASGTVLGQVTFYRSERPDPFESGDLALAEELVAHAAVCIDNARRYTREHTMAVALQRSLLPHGLPEQEAVEAAYRYLPSHAGVGGDWFDVIPLSGARVALVVGDVVGHGIQAAATMGRLRTAIHNFSALDLPPDELLAQLDDLVIRLDADADTPSGDGGQDITGTSCLYSVYDPSSGVCTLARAGHLPPALVTPDGEVSFPELPPGPPLGLGGMPFETAELHLPSDSQLVFFTDGLLENHGDDIGIGLDRLHHALASPGRPAEETCDVVLNSLLPARSKDDITLLVARTRTLGPERVASWDVPSDPAVVSTMRAAITRQLSDWHLDELAFATELMLSELITNAIRHATGPIQLRMLRTNSLICEVSDGSSTSPHLRRAATTEEGGRGLFLVAQIAQRWGTRYTANGKVIWTEQDIPSHG